MQHLNDTIGKYYKEKNHRKLIQSLVPYFNHQDISLRLSAHTYLIYFGKLCYKDKDKIPYCF